MVIATRIREKLETALEPTTLQVLNESGNHNVPPGSESHFKVVLVSAAFEGKRLVQRHQAVNRILAHELQNLIHALAIHTYTLPEWRDRNGDAPLSPPCLGGSAAERASH